MRFIFILITASLFFSNPLLGQQAKFEKEYRIKLKEVPPLALQAIDSLNFDRKIKWFKEEGLQTNSIEAKTKFEGKRYSVEFNLDGALEDIEIEVSWSELPMHIQSQIDDYLNTSFEKHIISKIQLQYIGAIHAMKNLLKSENAQVKYELIVLSKDNKSYNNYEFLFDEKGMFLEKKQIIQRNTDNIEY